MSSASDFTTVAKATALTSKYVVLVSEHIGRLQPSPGAGTRQTLNAATYCLHFNVKAVPKVRTCVQVGIFTGQQKDSLPLYFLPWQQNAALELTIPAGAGGPGVFMTSMLSGCTVQVHGTAASPTITHANARSEYENAYTQMKSVLEQRGGHQPKAIHILSESRGNTACTNEINSMLPTPVGSVGRVRKEDYALRVTDELVAEARQKFSKSLGFYGKLKQFDVANLGFKPKTGAFIYGIRDRRSNHWSFWYQAAVEVSIMYANWFGKGKDHKLTMDSTVLGNPTRFFPP